MAKTPVLLISTLKLKQSYRGWVIVMLGYCSLLRVALQINFESQGDYHNQRDRPKSLSLQVTRATVTNVRSLEQSSRADLGRKLKYLKYLLNKGSLFFQQSV